MTHEQVKALIETELSPKIVESVVEKSQAFSLLTRLKDMNSQQLKIRVVDGLPVAYFQATPTSKKKLTDMSWKGVVLTAEELAVIVVMSEADLADANYDIEGALRRNVEGALASKIDGAIFFGTDKPSSFPEGIVNQALAHGSTIARDVSKSMYSQLSDAMGYVEDEGYENTGILGGTSIKKVFRDMVDSTGQLITGDEISALPRAIVKNGAWDKDKAIAVVGDFKQGVYSVRQDLEVKVLTEGVIQDPSDGSILHNLAQEDKVGFRFTFRFTWALPVPANRLGGELPFAALVPAGSNKIEVSGPETQSFEDEFDVELVSSVKGAKIYYTDNGDTPTSASTPYTGKINLTATKTIKAIAIKEGYTNSDVFSATYTKSE